MRRSLAALAAVSALLVALPRGAAAQRVSGIVAGTAHGELVPYARVELVDTRGRYLEVFIRTDTAGHFSITAPSPGKYRLRASRVNYETRLTEVLELVKDKDKSTVISLDLTPDALAADMRIRRSTSTADSSEFSRRFASHIGRLLTYKEIRDQGYTDVAQILSAVPNAYVNCQASNGMGGVYCRVTLKGGPSSTCLPAYYMNGVPMGRSPMRPEEAVYTMPIASVQAIEIYSVAGSLPGIYRGPGSDCGVIAVWTKRPG